MKRPLPNQKARKGIALLAKSAHAAIPGRQARKGIALLAKSRGEGSWA